MFIVRKNSAPVPSTWVYFGKVNLPHTEQNRWKWIPQLHFPDSRQAGDKQAVLLGEWAGLGVRWSGVCHQFTNCGPSVPTGLYHYKGLHQTLPLRFAKQPQDMAADAMTLSPQAAVVFWNTLTQITQIQGAMRSDDHTHTHTCKQEDACTYTHIVSQVTNQCVCVYFIYACFLCVCECVLEEDYMFERVSTCVYECLFVRMWYFILTAATVWLCDKPVF